MFGTSIRDEDEHQTSDQESEPRIGQNRKQGKEGKNKNYTDTTDIGTERRTMLQKELDDMEEKRYRGAAVRCKVDTEQEDITTKYFLARQQNIQKSRTIKEIKKKNGELTI